MLPYQLLTIPLFKHYMTKSTHFHLLTPSPFISSGKIANPLFLISPSTIRGRRVQYRKEVNCFLHKVAPLQIHIYLIPTPNHYDLRTTSLINVYYYLTSMENNYDFIGIIFGISPHPRTEIFNKPSSSEPLLSAF